MTEALPPADELPPSRRRGCRRWVVRAIGAVVVVLVLLVGATVLSSRTHQQLVLPPAGQTVPTSPPQVTPQGSVRFSDWAVKQGSTDRHAEFTLPLHIAAGERLPVVVLLHGHGGTGSLVIEDGNWDAAVAADHLIVVTPEGVDQGWNAGPCCRVSTTLGIHDEQFLDALVDDLRLRPEVDPSRIFMVGESNGGMMTYRYLCDHAAKLAGAASVVGTNIAECAPNAPIPVLGVAGTADDVVPYDGGRSVVGVLLATRAFPPVVASMQALATSRHERCATRPQITRPATDVTLRTWSGCRSTGRVQLATIHGLAHGWPRGPTYDGTDEILRFFGLAG